MTETEQLREEVAELRTAVLNIGWHLDKLRIGFMNTPSGQQVNDATTLQGMFSNLVSLCYAIGGLTQNTPPVENSEWCKALLEREGAPTFDEINRAFYAAQNAAIEARAAARRDLGL
jgi:hypothetical protein